MEIKISNYYDNTAISITVDDNSIENMVQSFVGALVAVGVDYDDVISAIEDFAEGKGFISGGAI